MNSSVKRQLLVLAGMVVTACVALWYFGSLEPDQVRKLASGVEVTVHVVVRAQTDTLMAGSLTATSPLSALSALEQEAAKASLAIAIRQYDFGKLVVSIGHYTAGPDGDWSYRVNDSLIPVAAENCQLADGDRLEFRFDKGSDTTGQATPDSII